MRLTLLITLALILSASCDSKQSTPPPPTGTTAPEPKPEAANPSAVVLEYYQHMAAGEFEDAYKMVNASDQSARPVEEFVASAANPLQHAIIKKRTYEIKGTNIVADTAKVSLESTGPDIAKLQTMVINDLLKENSKVPAADVLKQRMQEWVEKPDAPVIVTAQQVFLIREDGQWRLDFDWDVENALRDVPTQQRPSSDAGNATD